MAIAGPDGVGKSTLSEYLSRHTLACFEVRLVHHRQGLGVLPTRSIRGDVTDPHRSQPYSTWVSAGKTVYLALDFLIGWLVNVRPFVRRGGWMIAERGWWDIAVDPGRYRLRSIPWLVRAVGRMLPSPDVVVVLESPPEVILGRKSELPAEELQRQTKAWRRILPAHQRKVFVDASLPADEVARRATGALTELIAERPRPFHRHWVNLPRRGNARWIVPRFPAAATTAALALYHPVTWRGALGWTLARVVARLGAFRLLPPGRPPPQELLDALDGYVGDEKGLAVARSNHPGRYVALIPDAGRKGTSKIAKIALPGNGHRSLEAEAHALATVAPLLSHPLRPPVVVAHDDQVLLLEAVPWRLRTRPWYLPEEVAFTMGKFFAAESGQIRPVHGDFAPWNLLRVDDGWAVLDWEEASTAGEPFVDILHYLVQAHALLGRPSKRALLKGLDGKGAVGVALSAFAAGAGVELQGARAALLSYLGTSIEQLDPQAADGRRGLLARRELLRDISA